MPRGLLDLFDERLPINRKERYYTGTVLPMIVASDGFKHFGRFLALCGMPEVALEADPNSANIQFLTEYGFEESLKDGAEKRFRDPCTTLLPATGSASWMRRSPDTTAWQLNPVADDGTAMR